MPDHDPTIPYQSSGAIRRLTDLAGWDYHFSGQTYSVMGACPRCFAPDQSGSTVAQGVLVGDGADRGLDGGDEDGGAEGGGGGGGRARPDPTVDVDVQCECDGTHSPTKTGCGAEWFVRIGDLT